MEAPTSRGGGPLPVPSSAKDWRSVSDHHSFRNGDDELELEHSNLVQSDERTIFEVQHGREPVDVDFCSITVGGSLNNDILQQRIHSITRQREELQQMEIEAKAQMLARSEIIEMQKSFDARIKEHVDSTAKLQKQLSEREQTIHEMERRMEEKERELHAIKLDNEAAWAKEDLLIEQDKELANFRRERDRSEAERAQQIRDFQEHIQEKERQILELQEQHRANQETIFLKDEQLKVLIARAQEMDALQSNTSHSLHAELLERTEQYNQLWLGYQRQLAEMERLHLHTIQQLHSELANARERSGSYHDESHESRVSLACSKDISDFDQNSGNHLDVNGTGTKIASNGALSNGNANNSSDKSNHAACVPVAPSSLLGMPFYLPHGQVTALHPFFLHQQGLPHSIPSPVPQSHVGHLHSVPAMSSPPQLENHQAASEGVELSSQTDHGSSRSGENYDYGITVNGQGFHPDYLDVHISQGVEPDSVTSSAAGEPQVLDSKDNSYSVSPQPDQGLQQISSHFNDSLCLNSNEQQIEIKEENVLNLVDRGLHCQALTQEPSLPASALLSETSAHSVNPSESTINNGAGIVSSETAIPCGKTVMAAGGKISETELLDERSLLACIVRTIPAGGRIRINSTLPNRLGKMLAPLHWHDYKRKYGKLDDFVAGHPELFLIEGEYIQLREGAQEMIAATAAVAKVAAAAAAASSAYSSHMPSVAVTPMAQSRQLKRVSSIDLKQPNGVSFGGISEMKILSKSEYLNGSNSGIVTVSSTQSNWRSNLSSVGKQHGRI